MDVYFEVMGLHPVLGRLLTPADDGQNAAGAVVLTYHFWRTSLHSDPSVIGKTVRLESCCGARSATVVGVLERIRSSIRYATEIIANIVTSPHHLSATMVTGREHRMTGSLRPASSRCQCRQCAGRKLRSVHGAMVAAHPEVYKPGDHFKIDVTRMHEQHQFARQYDLVDTARSGGPAFRDCELERCQSGARTNGVANQSWRYARRWVQALRCCCRSLLAESFVLCASGAVAAAAPCHTNGGRSGRYASRFSARSNDLTLDFSMVWFGIGLALIAAAVFLAFIPRLPSANAPQGGLTGRGTRVAGGSSRRLRIFAVTQIAASFLLLGGACVLMKTRLCWSRRGRRSIRPTFWQ